ncbi:MAG: hypothetical protein AAB275_07435, partial [Deltaproteobacteria bacterium]
ASDEFRKVADIIAQQFYEIGIEVEIRPVAFTDIRPSEKYDAILCDINILPLSNIWGTNSLNKGEHLNLSNYSSKEADDLLNQLNTTTDAREKKRISGMLDRVIHEDAPAVFIYHIVDHSVVSSRFKEGSEFRNESYSFYKIKDMDIGQ